MTWRFKIISAGWNCAQFIDRTLQSIDVQDELDYDLYIVDDATGEQDRDQAAIIERWCSTRPNWHYQINTEHLFIVRNQVEAIERANPDPEDVIIFLDLDGDQ
jgi:hypothetical protein